MYLKSREKGINLCTVTPTFKNYCLIAIFVSLPYPITPPLIPSQIILKPMPDMTSSHPLIFQSSLEKIRTFLNRENGSHLKINHRKKSIFLIVIK